MKKKTNKLRQSLKSHISGTLEAISLKCKMWSAEVGGRVHSKNRLVLSRQDRATEVRKLRFLSSCQYTHGCCAPVSWAARHTTVCLDYKYILHGEADWCTIHPYIIYHFVLTTYSIHAPLIEY